MWIVYNTTLVRKLGHSHISQKHFEIGIERERRSRGEKRSLRERALDWWLAGKLKLGFGILKN